MYASGSGVPLDYVEAYKWLSLGAAQNFRPAVDARRSIAGIMTKRQLSAAGIRIFEWQQHHLDAPDAPGGYRRHYHLQEPAVMNQRRVQNDFLVESDE
jgi:TPR repeat protein